MTKWPLLYDYSPSKRRGVYRTNLFFIFYAAHSKRSFSDGGLKQIVVRHADTDVLKEAHLHIPTRDFSRVKGSIYQKFWTLIAASVLQLYTAVWDLLMLLKNSLFLEAQPTISLSHRVWGGADLKLIKNISANKQHFILSFRRKKYLAL